MSRLALIAVVFVSIVVDRSQGAEPDADLPLKKIVLFNSGVGYFEHRGAVTGDAEVSLKFSVDDVNDLLKSLVPQDLDGGRVSTVTYGSRDPITKTLQTFAVDLTKQPTLAELLVQVRGEKVEVETAKTITGTILGVEGRKRAVGDEVLEEDYLNLLTDAGLTSVALTGVQRIRLLNDKLDAELRQALSVLAMGNANEKKSVSLRFFGEGKRRVQVGYVQEAPIWKTSYRLVLGEEQPLLQGWAIVENTTEDDWNDVNLSLVSGRPISFIMDLYQPLYVHRPTVEPEFFASLRPQTYGQDMAAAEREFAKKADGVDALARRQVAAAPPAAAMAKSLEMQNRGLADRNANAAADEKRTQFGLVASAASAADVGELFQYVIDSPVSLARQKSAMLPIVAEKVDGKKVSIYNEQVHDKHPLNGLRLKNSTNLHLMQGPVTVYDDGAYAGDARIEDLPPGSERLLSYAMDLETEVAHTSRQHPTQLISVKIARGILSATNRLEREKSYTVKNSGDKPKSVLIEYPLESQWELTAPTKPTEKTRDRYRFLVDAAPGKPSELKIVEQQTVSNQIVLSNTDSNQFLIYLRSKVVSDEVRAALERIRRQQADIAELRQQLQRIDQQVKVIEQEQARIRQNMDQLDRNSELYLRYVKKFTEQEDQIEKLRLEAESIRDRLDKAVAELNDYAANLNVE